jgi:hypothetical protein
MQLSYCVTSSKTYRLQTLFGSALLLATICQVMQAQETRPIGKTAEDQTRNAVLLGGYDYGKYVESLTGYTGQDRQRIICLEYRHAIRTRVGPRGNYKAAMTLLVDGKLVLAACRRDVKQNPPRFVIQVYLSADNGLSWKEIGKSPLMGKEPSLVSLPDGALILTAQKDGRPFQIHCCRSSDGGRTWSTDALSGQDYPRNLIVEPDGSVLLIRALAPGWPDLNEAKPSPNLQLGRSKDGGRTWQLSKGLVGWKETKFGEVSSLRLKDGRLLAALRTQVPGTHGEGFNTTVLTESSDDGRHWSKPRTMLNTAEVHAYLTELHDGRILATYSNYHLPWGVYAVVSKDGGKTWDLEHPIELALSAGFYVGWGVTRQLADGSLLTCYANEAYWRDLPPGNVVTEVVRWELP